MAEHKVLCGERPTDRRKRTKDESAVAADAGREDPSTNPAAERSARGRARALSRVLVSLLLHAAAMSFFSALKSFATGFAPQKLTFGEISVTTTALLAEGGYSYVYSAKEVGLLSGGKMYAAKKVIAQDAETDAIAETESRLLQQLDGTPGFVRCYGATVKQLPNKTKEYWMLLEFCPNGSLVDLLYRKNARTGAFEKRPLLPTLRVLEVFEMVCQAVAHMHALTPPVTHRDLKLENVLGAADGAFVLCDFGSATTEVLQASRTRKQAATEEERISKYSTLMYRAPEMVDLYRNQEVGPKADVWALGCILFSLAYGEHPFADESSLQILNAVRGGPNRLLLPARRASCRNGCTYASFPRLLTHATVPLGPRSPRRATRSRQMRPPPAHFASRGSSRPS